MTNKEFEKKSAEKAKEVEEKLKEQNEEKTDDIEQTNKERYSRYTRLISLMI